MSRSFEFNISLALASIIFVAPLVGGLFTRQFFMGSDKLDSFPIRFTLGVLLSNFLLLLCVLIFPFNIFLCWIIFLLGLAILLFKVCSDKRSNHFNFLKVFSCESYSEALLIICAPLLVSIWCRELLQPAIIYEDFFIIRSWPDVLVHLAQIGMLARGSGFASLSDPSMLGATPHIYHVTSYLFPALMTYLSNGNALLWYSCLLVPLGMLLTSLSAYSLAMPFFGRWPGFLAGIGILSLPDAFQLGFGNQLMGGYYWMQMISPALPYGIASASLAFIFLTQGCLSRKMQYIFLAYFFAGLTLVIKAQIFVSISFIVFIVPAFYFGSSSMIKRALLVLLLSGIYFGVIYVSQDFPSLPLIRFDGSALGAYSHLIVSNQEQGVIGDIYSWIFQGVSNSWLLRATLFSAFMLTVSIGMLLPAYLTTFFFLRKKIPNLVIWIPLIVAFNYIVMATGLALDNRSLGSPEDLLHRPYIWMYFIFATFTSAGICRLICDYQFFTPKLLLSLLTIILLLQFLAPFSFHRQIQHYKAWKAGDLRIPYCQFKVAQYIAAHGSINEVIQDSGNDVGFIFTGLSARQAYALDTKGVRVVEGLNGRLTELNDVIMFSDGLRIKQFMQDHGIQWYVRNIKQIFNWPSSINNNRVMSCGDYELYRF